MKYSSIVLDDSYNKVLTDLIVEKTLEENKRARDIWNDLGCGNRVFGKTSLRKRLLGNLVVFDQLIMNPAQLDEYLFGVFPADDRHSELIDIISDNNKLLNELMDKEVVKASKSFFSWNGESFDPYTTYRHHGAKEELIKIIALIEEHKGLLTGVLKKDKVISEDIQLEEYLKSMYGIAFDDDIPFLEDQLRHQKISKVLKRFFTTIREANRLDVPILSDLVEIKGIEAKLLNNVQDDTYQLTSIVMDDVLSYPQPSSLEEAVCLNANPAVRNLKDGLLSWSEEISNGDSNGEQKARKELRQITKAMHASKVSGKIGRFVTYVSIPVAIADMLISGGFIGLTATAVGASVQAISDLNRKKIRLQIFGM